MTTRAPRNAILGWREGVLRVAVTAVPERGKANAAVLRVLAESLAVAPSRLAIRRGGAGRDKQVEVTGLEAEELALRLQAS